MGLIPIYKVCPFPGYKIYLNIIPSLQWKMDTGGLIPAYSCEIPPFPIFRGKIDAIFRTTGYLESISSLQGCWVFQFASL